MKNKVVLLLAGCLVWLMSSCLGSSDYDTDISNDSQITTFKMQHDSVKGLDKVRFTIDQLASRIYNRDSMPLGTKIEKVICTVSFASGTGQVQVMQEAKGDTIFWNATDSLDFSKPVKFVTHSLSGLHTKTYIAQVNVHQVVPDSMVWEPYANNIIGISATQQKVLALELDKKSYYYMYIKPAQGNGYKLYRAASSSANVWTELPLTGLPNNEISVLQITEYEDALYAPGTNGIMYHSANGQDWAPVNNTPVVKYLLGAITLGGVNQTTHLATIIDDQGLLKFSSMNQFGEWKMGGYVTDDFPVTGFSATNHPVVYKEQLTLACGRNRNNELLNSVWATMDGLSWAVLTDDRKNKLPKAEGVMLSYYDKKFFLIGGLDPSGKGTKTIYNSKDNGVSWTRTDTLVVLPTSFAPIGYGQALVDEENYLHIFGGKTQSNSPVLDQIWRGRINRLGFKD